MVSSESAPSKKIILMSSDGQTFAVEESVALVCQTLKNMIDDNCAGGTIPLPNVSSKILSKVLEYCKHHACSAAAKEPNNLPGGGAAAPEPNNLPGGETVNEELKKFDADFVNVDEGTLLSLVLAANYLDIKQLLDLTCETVADMIKDKSVEEVRKIFNVENDFTAAEEEAIRKEHPWVFE